MTDKSTTNPEPTDQSYDGRKSGRRENAGGTVEVRVRAERHRHWPDETKLRIARAVAIRAMTIKASTLGRLGYALT